MSARLHHGLLLVLLLAGAGHGEDRYWIGSQRSARILGMGGCYTANTRPGEAHRFNPAGLRLHGARRPFALTLDPLAAALPPDLDGEDESAYATALPGLAVVRGVYLGGSRLAAGLVPAEYLPAHPAELATDPGTGKAAPEAFTPALVLAFSLDSRISLGLAGSYCWDQRHDNRRLAVSYGLLVKVNRVMDVGAVAVSLSGDNQATGRRWIDRVDDRTINVGLSWFPLGRTLDPAEPGEEGNRRDLHLALAADIRNVTQEGQGYNSQEMHLGAALGWRQLGELRAGVYWPKDPLFPRQAPVRSLSIGLLRSTLWGITRQPLPFDTLLDLTWMDNPLAERGNGLWIASLALGL